MILHTNYIRRFFRNLNQVERPAIVPIPKKVILTSTALDLTGAQRQLVNTCVEVKKTLGAPMKVFFLGMPNPKAGLLVKTLEAHKIDMLALNKFESKIPKPFHPLLEPMLHFAKQDSALILTLHNRFMQERPEVVHGWGMATGAISAVAALMTGVPKIIVGWRGMSPLTRTETPELYKTSFSHHKEVYQQLLHYPQIKFMANSQTVLEDFSKWMKCDVKRFNLIYNGLDTEFLDQFPLHDLRKELGIAADRTVVGGMFRFHHDKHPELWVETAKVLLEKRPDLLFLMAGTGALVPTVQKLIQDYNLEKHIFLLGQHVNVRSFYESLDCFLLTSRSSGEGLPNVLVEAQYFGTPVVTTPGGGAVETLMEDITGTLCVENDPIKLANHVHAILDQKLSRTFVRKTYNNLIKERFLLSDMGRRFIHLYGYEG